MATNWNSESAETASFGPVTYVLEERQHLIVGSVIGNEETDIGITEHSSNSDQTGSTTWNDTDVLPCVLAGLALSVVLVVKFGNSSS